LLKESAGTWCQSDKPPKKRKRKRKTEGGRERVRERKREMRESEMYRQNGRDRWTGVTTKSHTCRPADRHGWTDRQEDRRRPREGQTYTQTDRRNGGTMDKQTQGLSAPLRKTTRTKDEELCL
jgi:hypothetical protein